MSTYIISTKEGIEYRYDTSKGQIINQSSGLPINISPNILGFREKKKGKLLRILLGTKCNYDCSYCSQAFSRTDSVEVSPKVINDFLEKTKDILTDIYRIEFWGGEPLVYIKYLYLLVPELRKRFPDALFTMVSNGSLLTDGIGDFLAENRILFTISHDAYAHKITRGKDILESPEHLECIKRTYAKINKVMAEYLQLPKVNFCGFNLVYTKHCLDPIRVQEWFNSKLGEYVAVSCDPVMGMGNGAENSSLDFSLEDLKNLAANTFKAGMQEPNTYPYTIAEDGMRFIRDLYANTKVIDASSLCGIAEGRSVVVDLLGNLYPCQNFVQQHHVRGNIYLEGFTKPITTNFKESKYCTNCPVVMLCRGGCPLSEGNGFVKTCNAKFWYKLGIFASAFKRITGHTPTKLKGNIVRPLLEAIPTSEGKSIQLTEVNIPQYE